MHNTVVLYVKNKIVALQRAGYTLRCNARREQVLQAVYSRKDNPVYRVSAGGKTEKINFPDGEKAAKVLSFI